MPVKPPRSPRSCTITSRTKGRFLRAGRFAGVVRTSMEIVGCARTISRSTPEHMIMSPSLSYRMNSTLNGRAFQSGNGPPCLPHVRTAKRSQRARSAGSMRRRRPGMSGVSLWGMIGARGRVLRRDALHRASDVRPRPPSSAANGVRHAKYVLPHLCGPSIRRRMRPGVKSENPTPKARAISSKVISGKWGVANH